MAREKHNIPPFKEIVALLKDERDVLSLSIELLETLQETAMLITAIDHILASQ